MLQVKRRPRVFEKNFVSGRDESGSPGGFALEARMGTVTFLVTRALSDAKSRQFVQPKLVAFSAVLAAEF